AIEWKNLNTGKTRANVLDTTVGTAVIDDEDVMLEMIVLDCFDHGRQALGQQVLSIPVHNDDGGFARMYALCLCGSVFSEPQSHRDTETEGHNQIEWQQ